MDRSTLARTALSQERLYLERTVCVCVGQGVVCQYLWLMCSHITRRTEFADAEVVIQPTAPQETHVHLVVGVGKGLEEVVEGLNILNAAGASLSKNFVYPHLESSHPVPVRER